ncbi:type II toxin-antitoxin system CcdA family antitoxin [Leminorella grimontii]|uniref:type II toxin-antitoxin system CcdA family antitoxin n=1 Tax=Leminorella grimontii TaxID=82981 RepID=UPI0032207D8B
MMKATGEGRKRGTNVYLNADLVELAKELNVNLSATLNEALDVAVRQRLRERWLEENREGIKAMNHFVERNGLFTDDESFQVL